MKKTIKFEQLDFIPLTDSEKLLKSFEEVRASSDKVRRGIFKKHSELNKKIDELTCQINNLQDQLLVMQTFVQNHLETFVLNALSKMVENGLMDTSQVVGLENVTYADPSNLFAVHEIGCFDFSK